MRATRTTLDGNRLREIDNVDTHTGDLSQGFVLDDYVHWEILVLVEQFGGDQTGREGFAEDYTFEGGLGLGEWGL